MPRHVIGDLKIRSRVAKLESRHLHPLSISPALSLLLFCSACF